LEEEGVLQATVLSPSVAVLVVVCHSTEAWHHRAHLEEVFVLKVLEEVAMVILQGGY